MSPDRELTAAEKVQAAETELQGIVSAISAALIAVDESKLRRLKDRQEDLEDMLPILRDQAVIEELSPKLLEAQRVEGAASAELEAAQAAMEDAEVTLEASKRLHDEATKRLREAQYACTAKSSHATGLLNKIETARRRITEHAQAVSAGRN